MKKIKSKILTGMFFLFIVIIILGAAGIIFVNQLSQSSKGTIKNNYRSIAYTVKMNNSLQDIYDRIESGHTTGKEIKAALAVIDSNAALEAANITETGEKELSQNLQMELTRFSAIINSRMEDGNVPFRESYLNLRNTIDAIYSINMDAVYKRNNEADNTAAHATLVMIILSSLCVIITLPFILYFPQWIVNPILVLNEKINSVTAGRYNQKLNINRNDEIGELAASFNIMAEKLRKYEASSMATILLEKRRLDAVIQNLQDGVIILDGEGRIIKMNKTVLQLTSLKEGNIANAPAAEIALKNDLLRKILNFITDKSTGAKPIKIVSEGEEQFYSVEAINISIDNDASGGSETGKVIIVNNITTYQKRDAAKTNLIATVSHELKTPISSINLSLKLLDDNRIGSLNEEQKKLIYSLRQQSNRLSKVINELLDFSQAETGNIKLNITSVLCEDIVDLSVTALMMIISEKNIQLETVIDDNLPPVKADIEKTVWVLVNIIGNAIRFTPPGGTVTLMIKQEKGLIRFAVKDEGPGIPDADKIKIFDKFVQVGRPSTGTGLGLAIAKEFVQSQGGEIGVKDNDVKGAEFYFSLPAYLIKGT